jgi:hypothetical protein
MKKLLIGLAAALALSGACNRKADDGRLTARASRNVLSTPPEKATTTLPISLREDSQAESFSFSC